MTEKIHSQEEKIRRAEEIYYRRKNMNYEKNEYATLNFTYKRDYSLLKRMLKQIFLCLCIYLSFYAIQNFNYLLSEQLKTRTKEVLSYDIDLKDITDTLLHYINEFNNINAIIPEQNREKVNDDVEYEENNNTNELVSVNEEIKNLLANNVILEMNNDDGFSEEASSISQMQIDADYIKQNFSFIKPVNGVISSKFGTRNPTTPTVPKYHTGTDIAAKVGTVIVAAMEGVVTQVSSVGDYGNHLRIINNDITTLYAHCNKIYVKEGEKIVQGQKIAEVGATGNVTGAHLHFEIRRNNEYVDPEYVINL